MPIAGRLEELLDVNETCGLTFLELNTVEISQLIKSICRTKIKSKPVNLSVCCTLDEESGPKKKELITKQWKH